MKRVIQELAWVCGVLLFSSITVSLWFSLPLSWIVHPILFFSVILLLFGFPERALLLGGIGGVIIDLHSALPFGVMTSALLLSLSFVSFSQEMILKDRAIHTVVVHTIVATAVYHLLILLFIRVVQTIGAVSPDLNVAVWHLLRIGLLQAVIHAGLVSVVYASTVLFRHRFVHSTL